MKYYYIAGFICLLLGPLAYANTNHFLERSVAADFYGNLVSLGASRQYSLPRVMNRQDTQPILDGYEQSFQLSLQQSGEIVPSLLDAELFREAGLELRSVNFFSLPVSVDHVAITSGLDL